MAFCICLLWLRVCSKMLVNEGFCVSSAQFHPSAALFRAFIILVLFVGMAGLRARCFEECSDCKLLCVNSGGCMEKKPELLSRPSYCNVIRQCNTFSNAFKVSLLTQRVNKLLPGSNIFFPTVFPSVPTKKIKNCGYSM